MKQGEQRRVGEQLAEDLEAPLAASHAGEPVVDERDARAGRRRRLAAGLAQGGDPRMRGRQYRKL